MTHRTGIRLPASVTLPDDPALTAGDVCEALGVSRAVIYYWRTNHQFPRFERVSNATLVRADALAAWLEARGVTVRRLRPGTRPLEVIR